MFKNTLKTRTLLGGLLYSLIVSSPLYADDTEVFFGDSPDLSSVRPNVLLILDSAGSMSSNVQGSDLNQMETMRLALHRILDSVTSINLGLMRYNTPGGPILYPVANLDSTLTAGTVISGYRTVKMTPRGMARRPLT